MILDELPTDELKRLFMTKISKFNQDLIINFLKFSWYGNQRKYIPADTIIFMMKEEMYSDNILTMYKALPDEEKLKIYKSEWFMSKANLEHTFNKLEFIQNSPDSIILDVADEKVKDWSFRLFKDTGRTIFLKFILDKDEYSNKIANEHILTELTNILFKITENRYDELGSEYQKKLAIFINNFDDDNFLKYYFKCYMTYEFQSKEVQNIMFNKLKLILENNKVLMIEELSSDIIKSNDSKLLDIVISRLSKSDLLLLSIRNPYINNYVLDILQEHPDYFKSVKIDNIDKYLMPKLDISYIDKFLKVSNHLTYDQINIYYIPYFINNNSNIREYYKKDVTINYDHLSCLSDLSLFTDYNDINNILSNIGIKKLMELLLYKSIKSDNDLTEVLRSNLDNRISDIANFINDKENVIPPTKRVILFKVIHEDKIEELINKINNTEILADLLTKIKGVSYTKIESRLVNLYNNALEHEDFAFTPFFSNKQKEETFFYKLSFDTLVNLVCYEGCHSDKNSKKTATHIGYIVAHLDLDINKIFNINVITRIDELLTVLPEDYSLKIKAYIDDKYNQLKDKYPKLNEYVFSYSTKANYVNGIMNNLINDNNYKDLLLLCGKNKFLFDSMNLELLKPVIMQMGTYFIDKTSRYPVIANKLTKIYNSNMNKFNIILELSKKIQIENDNNLYDQKMEMIINYLYNNEIIISEEISPSLLSNIEDYILEQSIDPNNKFSNLKIDNYITNKNKLLDEMISTAKSVEELRSFVFLRYFGLQKDKVDSFLISYVENFDEVADCLSVSYPINYINNINLINNSNIEEIKKIILTLPEYTLSDFINIKNIIVNTYNKYISEEIKKNINGSTEKMTINNEVINVEDITASFGIFVHSTGAYGNMPLINDDYFDSWNYNSNTRNHGICTSYISNSSYGTAAVNGSGVMFGFYNIERGSIPLLAPYDLVTKNNGYNISSRRKPYFQTLRKISCFTRHTHNEISIERRIILDDGTSILRQPDCIIIFEDMSDEIKANSIKAYNDFKKHGVDIKIKYIDRVKNAENEASKLYEEIIQYENAFDLNLLANIIDRYESNICGCDFLGKTSKKSLNLFDQKKLFQTNKISELLYSTVEYIKNTPDINLRNELLKKFRALLDFEQKKFDLLAHDGHRYHTFELYSEKIKSRNRKYKYNE